MPSPTSTFCPWIFRAKCGPNAVMGPEADDHGTRWRLAIQTDWVLMGSPSPNQSRLSPVALLLFATITTACGGASDPGPQSGQLQSPTETANSSPTTGEPASTGPTAPSAGSIRVEDMSLVYLPDQVGGNFHTLTVVLRGGNDERDLGQSAQIASNVYYTTSMGSFVERTRSRSRTLNDSRSPTSIRRSNATTATD